MHKLPCMAGEYQLRKTWDLFTSEQLERIVQKPHIRRSARMLRVQLLN